MRTRAKKAVAYTATAGILLVGGVAAVTVADVMSTQTPAVASMNCGGSEGDVGDAPVPPGYSSGCDTPTPTPTPTPPEPTPTPPDPTPTPEPPGPTPEPPGPTPEPPGPTPEPPGPNPDPVVPQGDNPAPAPVAKPKAKPLGAIVFKTNSPNGEGIVAKCADIASSLPWWVWPAIIGAGLAGLAGGVVAGKRRNNAAEGDEAVEPATDEAAPAADEAAEPAASGPAKG